MIDMHNPLVPTFAGCFSADGYTHDAQCINYDGPDTRLSSATKSASPRTKTR